MLRPGAVVFGGALLAYACGVTELDTGEEMETGASVAKGGNAHRGGSGSFRGGYAAVAGSGGWSIGGTYVTGGRALTGGVRPSTGGVRPTGGVAPTAGMRPATGATAGTGGVRPFGGTAPSGGGSAGWGGSGNAGPGGAGGMLLLEGGYVVSGPWAGYAWTAVAGSGTTITPNDYSTLGPGGQLCASGVVAADADYGGVAMIGINLNQAQQSDSVGEWTPAAGGLAINVSNPENSPLRVMIQGLDGDTDASHRWCVNLVQYDQPVFIPWTSFNTECWSATGTDYAGQPLATLVVYVPGSNSTAIAYDFCINSVAPMLQGAGGQGGAGGAPASGGAGPVGGNPAGGGNGGAGGMGEVAGNGAGGTAGSAGTAGGPTMLGSGTLTAASDYTFVVRNDAQYIVQNNVWAETASQTVTYRGTSFQVTSQTGNNSVADGPVSFPSVFIGSSWQRGTQGSNLPKQVGALTSIDMAYAHNASASVSGTFAAVLDLWFSTSAVGDPGDPSAGELMVWLHASSGVTPEGTALPSFTLAGMAFDVWYASADGKPSVTYLAQASTATVSFDLGLFVKDAISRGYLQNGWYLTAVFAGFDIYGGGEGLAVLDFYATVK